MPEDNSRTTTNNGLTWKWLAGSALTVTLALGGASYRDLNARQETSSSESNRRITALEVDLAQEKVRNDVHYHDIIRRLEELKAAMESVEATVNRRYR